MFRLHQVVRPAEGVELLDSVEEDAPVDGSLTVLAAAVVAAVRRLG